MSTDLTTIAGAGPAPVPDLDLTGTLPEGRVVVEASAGTGKTYSLSALVVRYVAERELTASQLLVVTFTRAAAAELRDRVRASLVEAKRVLEGGQVPVDQQWMQVLLSGDTNEQAARAVRVTAAIATFDDATIATIHAFCQQTLRQLGLRAGTRLGSELGESTSSIIDEVCRDLLVGELWQTPDRLDWPKNDGGAPSVLSKLVEAVRTVLNNPGALIEPDPATVKPIGRTDSPARFAEWVRLVNLAVDKVAERREARQELGYDDLVNRLRDAVVDPVNGREVVKALRARYGLVLVDEFQDTDPVQWQIFDTAFSGNLITVGDPKQAIYRFRGADVNAYLQAVAGEHVTKVGLSTNYRSDVDLVAATNALIGGVELGNPQIVPTPVSAAPHATQRAASPGAPIEIRRLADDPAMHTTRGLSSGLARRAIVGDLVNEVVTLMRTGRIATSKEDRSVHAGDIAVLVPFHSNADVVVRALLAAGVPAVRTRTGSVFATEAAREWQLLFGALERFTHAPTVRAGALGVFLHRSVAALDPKGDEADAVLADLQRHCADWADRLTKQPLLAWYDTLRSESGMVQTLLGELGGERMLTDLDHIAELLAAELGGVGHSPASVLRALEGFIADAEDADDTGPQMRRIDSDAEAVQITTLHGAKGLEYPIVLLPFCWLPPINKGPLIYNNASGRRVIDVATGQGWHGPTNDDKEPARKHRAATEQRGDHLRLLYVGLTRAEHRTIVWYAPVPSSNRSALAYVLFDRDDQGNPRGTSPTLDFSAGGKVLDVIPKPLPDNATAERVLGALSVRSGGLIAHTTIAPYTRRPRWTAPAGEESSHPLAVADPDGRVVADPTWSRWSFTGLTRAKHDAWAPPPNVGGNDEGDDNTDEHGAVVPIVTTEMPWADVFGGKHFGVLVHEVMERVDFTSPTVRTDLAHIVDVQMQRARVNVAPDVLVEGAALSIETPLGPLAFGRRLADIARPDRLAELTFDLPLLDTRTRVATARIGEVLLDTLAADDVVRPYAQRLADGRFDTDIAGFLQGSIDALLRVHGPDGRPRFIVVDYKTNLLHRRGTADPLGAYHPNLLIDGMEHNDYPLQALLYSVAVHRFLSWRLHDYDPAVHLGGIAYLFMRGMVGASTPLAGGRPYGVFAWRPPADAIVALHELFAPGGAA